MTLQKDIDHEKAAPSWCCGTVGVLCIGSVATAALDNAPQARSLARTRPFGRQGFVPAPQLSLLTRADEVIE
jgi:hypothetical protein